MRASMAASTFRHRDRKASQSGSRATGVEISGSGGGGLARQQEFGGDAGQGLMLDGGLGETGEQVLLQPRVIRPAGEGAELGGEGGGESAAIGVRDRPEASAQHLRRQSPVALTDQDTRGAEPGVNGARMLLGAALEGLESGGVVARRLKRPGLAPAEGPARRASGSLTGRRSVSRVAISRTSAGQTAVAASKPDQSSANRARTAAS
jgi:hypothetical protein